MECACLGIECSVDDARNTRVHQGAGTHRTRLQCHVQNGVVQPPMPAFASCGSQSENFRVSRGIRIRFAPVFRSSQNQPIEANDDRSYRHIAVGGCGVGVL